jgi:hypothetical protein
MTGQPRISTRRPQVQQISTRRRWGVQNGLLEACARYMAAEREGNKAFALVSLICARGMTVGMIAARSGIPLWLLPVVVVLAAGTLQ